MFQTIAYTTFIKDSKEVPGYSTSYKNQTGKILGRQLVILIRVGSDHNKRGEGVDKSPETNKQSGTGAKKREHERRMRRPHRGPDFCNYNRGGSWWYSGVPIPTARVGEVNNQKSYFEKTNTKPGVMVFMIGTQQQKATVGTNLKQKGRGVACMHIKKKTYPCIEICESEHGKYLGQNKRGGGRQSHCENLLQTTWTGRRTDEVFLHQLANLSKRHAVVLMGGSVILTFAGDLPTNYSLS